MEERLIIIGGGIAGLWLFRKLRDQGIRVLLVDKGPVGGIQTLASQGMIHGGQRYHLQGKKTEQGEGIAAMPAIWERCFEGTGEINLSKVQILAKNQHLWSPGGLAAGVSAFLASKAMNSRVRNLSPSELPALFAQAKSFKGRVYAMDEWVVDIKSLIIELVGPYAQDIVRGEFVQVRESKGGGSVVTVVIAGTPVEIRAEAVFFGGGLGNEIAVKDLKLDRDKPRTQRRPLKQIMVRTVEYPFYAHCITADPRPRMTITAHPHGEGYVWYLGGIVAEYGLGKSDDQAIAFARKELETLFPWIDWRDKEWACYQVDRAEPYFDGNFLKAGPEYIFSGSIALGWPTKLTFAPALASQIELWLKSIEFDGTKSGEETRRLDSHLELGKYPWEDALWQI